MNASLRPARSRLALCIMSRQCPVRDRCYRSPAVRAIAESETQNWMDATPQVDGPCEEWWSTEHETPTGEAIYLTADQVDEYRAAGWTVELFRGHHGAEGYHLATRDT